jgi:hypothetical protein
MMEIVSIGNLNSGRWAYSNQRDWWLLKRNVHVGWQMQGGNICRQRDLKSTGTPESKNPAIGWVL